MTTPRYRTGTCAVCSIHRALRMDGTMLGHAARDNPAASCDGSRQPPVPGSVIDRYTNTQRYNVPRLRPTGMCPECDREATVLTTGLMGAHGWFRDGKRMGRCRGSYTVRPRQPGVSR